MGKGQIGLSNLDHTEIWFVLTGDGLTVWKFQDFSVTQILREINFGEFKSAQSAVFAILEALNFYFYGFLHFLNIKITEFKAPKMSKTAILELWYHKKYTHFRTGALFCILENDPF